MKKKVLYILLGSFISMTGCTNIEKIKIQHLKKDCVIENKNAPKWVCPINKVNILNQYTAIGISPITITKFGVSKMEAIINARYDLKIIIKNDIKEKLYTFFNVINFNTNIDKLINKISEKVAQQQMYKTKVLKNWRTDNNIYILAGIKQSDTYSDINNKIISVLQKDEKLWNSFLKINGIYKLNNYIWDN